MRWPGRSRISPARVAAIAAARIRKSRLMLSHQSICASGTSSEAIAPAVTAEMVRCLAGSRRQTRITVDSGRLQ